MLSYFTRSRVAHIALVLATLPGCAEQSPVTLSEDAGGGRAIVRHAEDNAAVYWNEKARDLVATTGAATPFAIRGYAILSLAQYNATVDALAAKNRNVHPSLKAAVSAASVTVLTYLFPGESEKLEEMLAEYLDRSHIRNGNGNGHGNVEAGEVVGRDAGAQIVQRAQGDRFFAQWTGTIPTGPGMWYSQATPPSAGGAAFGQALTFLLQRSDQFRPPAPPAFDSPAFRAALTEVRVYSDNRSPQQDSIAKFWHLPAGTYAPPGYWNEEATTLALKKRMDIRRTAHTLALMNVVMYDALIASHEAKYTYWLLRPSQADAGITLSVGLPNFPSYPSNHAAISAGAAEILARAFPSEATRLRRRAEEASLSRVLGGIHYRFDGDAGLTLGRRVAAWAAAHDANGHRHFVLR